MGTTARRPNRPPAPLRGSQPIRSRNVRYPAPAAERLRPYRRRRRDPIPLVLRVGLAGTLLVLGVVTTAAASGLLGGALSGLGSTVARVFSAPLTGPSPTPSPGGIPGAPRLVLDGSGWTNQHDFVVHGFVPAGLDQTGTWVRIYINGEQAAEQALQGTQDFSVNVVIPDGPSQITATIVTLTGEGPESAPIQVVFDGVPPPLTISAPKNGASVTGVSVTVKGTTQPASTVTIRNDTNGGRASDVATDGTFAIGISVAGGTNALTVTAEDPAGNSTSTQLTVTGGSGKASVSVSLSSSSFSLKTLPAAITATARVVGPDGRPVNGAVVVFTFQIPGVGPVQSPGIVTSNGVATFSTQIPMGATAGAGLVTAQATTDNVGTISGSAAFRIT